MREERGAMRLKRTKRRQTLGSMQFEQLNVIAFSRCSDHP